MVLRLIEEKYPLDLILFCDTGLEFPQMYEHIDKLEKAIPVPIVKLRAETALNIIFCITVQREEIRTIQELVTWGIAGRMQESGGVPVY